MRQSIEHGAGQSLAAQHLGPLLEGKVRGDDQRLTLLRAADHLKQQRRAQLARGDVIQLVQDQQIELGEP